MYVDINAKYSMYIYSNELRISSFWMMLVGYDFGNMRIKKLIHEINCVTIGWMFKNVRFCCYCNIEWRISKIMHEYLQ